jgi:hypothetical protein
MPWCPKCKNQYGEGVTNCSICGCELVKDEKTEVNKVIVENDKEALLVSVSREMDAKIIESKLNAFGIPTLKNYRGIDQIYGNVSYSGIDIFVPSRLLDTARDIIEIKEE